MTRAEENPERDRGLAAAVPFRFACHRCARCCTAGAGYVWVEEHECAPLAHALGMNVEAFAALHLRRVVDPRDGRARLSLREQVGENAGERGGRCALLVGSNECSVYAARPAHCREFPYWPSVLAGGAGFEAARATCPGIAVVVDEERATRAHAALDELYASVGEPPPREHCCLDDERADELFATALEADRALEELRAREQHATARVERRDTKDDSKGDATRDAARDANGGVARDEHAACGRVATGPRRHAGRPSCRLGAAAPLACRLGGDPERFARAFERLRAIEREHDYPVAYGRMNELLRSRGTNLDRVSP